MKPTQLTNIEMKQMVETMATAFMDHQNWKTRIPSAKRRKKIMSMLFQIMFRVINQHGDIFVVKVDEKPVGYITYMDPSDQNQISFIRVIKTGGWRYVFPLLIHMTPKILKSMILYYKVYATHQMTNHLAMHLYSTAIQKEYRSKGYMKKALKNSFEYYFENGKNEIVLETSDESNVAIYQKLGFQLIEVCEKKEQKLFFFSYLKE
jgi:ribosomal protein S18 acetylase RimI-like enzyme